MSSATWRGATAVAIALAVLTVPASAQVTVGGLAGRVLDPRGLPIAGATVRVQDPARAVARDVVAAADGHFRVIDLSPGRYDVSAVAPGFDTSTHADVRVVVETTTHVDLWLPLAGLHQVIDVRAEIAPVKRDNADLSHLLERDRIARLPLNRRDFLQLALLTAGVSGPVEQSELSTRGAFAMHANGAREEFNDFLLDGVDNNDPYVNRYVVQPAVDAIEQFKVAVSSYSAEYGRSAGAQVNVVTRGGTNRLEAFAYDYWRVPALDARNAFDTANAPASHRVQVGGGVGGPLRRDRTFGFASLDVLRERRGSSRLAVVPSEAMRGGDFSAIATAILDPFTGRPFAGNVIPASRISPIGARIAALFPLPNTASTSANYLGRPVEREEAIQGTTRLDHAFGPAHRVAVRYSAGRTALDEPFADDAAGVPGFGDRLTDRAHNAMVEYQQVVAGRALHTVRFGANRFDRDLVNAGADAGVAQAWGVDWLPADGGGYPSITVAGYARLGDVTSLPIRRQASTLHLVDSLTATRGAHLVKLGADIRHVRVDGSLDLLTRGSLSFSGALSGNGLADLLLGLPSFAMQAKADNPQALRSTAVAFYVQDDWTPIAALTLNLGARYEYTTPPVDAHDGMTSFDPATGRLVQVGTSGVSRSGLRPDRNNVAPRVGLTWAPAANLVVRAGFGVYFDAGMLTTNSALYFNPPQFTLRAYFPTPTGLLTLANPFPSTGGITPPAALNVLASDLASSSLQHWNLAVERAVARVGTVTVAYAGSRGRDLVRSRDINQPRPGSGLVQLRRPDPRYGSIMLIESAGRSSYHALQATFERSLQRGATVRATYAWAKSMDDASAFLATKGDRNFPQDSTNLDAEWGRSSFDVRHRVTVAASAPLPARFAVTRQTEVRALFSARSGLSFTPVLRFDNSNTGNGGSTVGADRPNVVGSAALAHPTATKWFDTAAFSVPARYTFGNAGRNILDGPACATLDVSISRRLPLGGQHAAFVELQAFNVLNRTNLQQPEPYADDRATFGRILSAQPARQVQVALRLLF